LTTDARLKRLSVPIASSEQPVWVPEEYGPNAAAVLGQEPDAYDPIDCAFVFVLFEREFSAKLAELKENNIPHQT